MKRTSLVLAIAVAACQGAEPSHELHPSARVAMTVPEAAPPPPLVATRWVDVLALEGGGEAHVAIPIGVTHPVRVVVGVHGAGDRPDWSCTEWLEVMSREAFAVCPHGTPDPRWAGTRVWGSGAQVAKEATRALVALRAKYGPWLADEPLTYGAWSQGATLADGAVEALAKTERVDRVVLVEIGHTKVDADAMAKRFVASGIARVVVSCSSPPCRGFAGDFERASQRRGLSVHVTDVGNRGHWFDEPVYQALRAELPWLDGS